MYDRHTDGQTPIYIYIYIYIYAFHSIFTPAIFFLWLSEAAKIFTLLFLVARPLRGGGEGKGLATKKKGLFKNFILFSI